MPQWIQGISLTFFFFIKYSAWVSSFKYTDIENTILAKSIENADLQEENTLQINGKLETGTYRLVIKLLDKYNVEYSKKELNFIVE